MHVLRSCLARKPDLIFVHRLQAMSPVIRAEAERVPIFFDLDDIEHWKAARFMSSLPRWRSKIFHAVSILPLMMAERMAVNVAVRTYVCSEQDRKYLARVFLRSNIDAVANCAAPRVSEIPDTKSMLFIGPLGYRPNKMAADYLIGDIWPHILKRIPDATLTIVGSGPENLQSYWDAPAGVKFAGFVEDLAQVYRDARIICAPITAGGGTRIKIVEGAAHGRPIVSTSLGAEGLDLRDGTEILIRNEAGAFAQACIDLLTDKDFCIRVGSAAQRKVIKNHDREKMIDTICEGIKREIVRLSGPMCLLALVASQLRG